jgi:hypothetical protein
VALTNGSGFRQATNLLEDEGMVLKNQYVKSWWGQWLKIAYINILNAKGEWVRGYFTIKKCCLGLILFAM